MCGQVCGHWVVYVLRSIVWTRVGVFMAVLERVPVECVGVFVVLRWFCAFWHSTWQLFPCEQNTSLNPLQTPKYYLSLAHHYYLSHIPESGHHGNRVSWAAQMSFSPVTSFSFSWGIAERCSLFNLSYVLLPPSEIPVLKDDSWERHWLSLSCFVSLDDTLKLSKGFFLYITDEGKSLIF